MKSSTKSLLFSWSLCIAVVVLAVSSLLPRLATASDPMSLTGYAWSSNSGWISFDGAGYGVFESETTGALSGYAWSSNIGWITFNATEVTGCPSGTCAPKVDLATGNLSGWARACASFIDKNACSGIPDGGAGGWDGWISLSGTAADSSTYGVTQGADCKWSGYAWGSDTIGAVSASGIAADSSPYGVVGSDPAFCASVNLPPTAWITALPTSVEYNATSTLTWGSSGAVTSCTAPSGNWSNSGTFSGTGLTDPLLTTSTFTFQCTGPNGTSTLASATVTVLPQTCPNGATNPPTCDTCPVDKTMVEGVCINNCLNGADNPPVCDNFPTPSATLSANPETINLGQSSTLTWSSVNTTSCEAVGGFSTGGAKSNAVGVLVSPIADAVYQIVCDGSVYSNFANVTVLQPSVFITANKTRVQPSSTVDISYSAERVENRSCSISGPNLTTVSEVPASGTTLATSTRSVVINSQSKYTITCHDAVDSPVTRSVIVNIVPIFQEF